jgi:lauroyl/myristoyl acyltransferase
MEALIRRRPDQWYMFRDMWPRRPLPARAQPVAAPTMAGAAAS